MHVDVSIAKKKYPELVKAISQCLFEDDPVGINFENNTDEYDPEAATILAKLKDCKSENDVLKVVYTEFCRWFGKETTGSMTRYTKVSSLIWQIWILNKAKYSSHP